LIVEALDLVLLGVPSILATSLLLSDLIGLCNELLSTFLSRIQGILILVWLNEFDLGLDGVLDMR
jgi:hypothetical protein